MDSPIGVATGEAISGAAQQAQDTEVTHRHDWVWNEEKTEGYCSICRIDWEDRPADYEE